MGGKINFEKDDHKKEHEKMANVCYKVCPQEQKYHNESGLKDLEKRCVVKYNAGGAKSSVITKMSNTSVVSSSSQKSKKKSPPPKEKTCTSESTPSRSSRLSPTEIAAKCYDRKWGKKRSCTSTPKWQMAEYCRDDCGSGIVTRKFDFKSSKKLWCKTPLSMYQATIGELGRQILCREKIVPRDVRPGPPCNIDHDILPPCRGYYRKYDCIRPCEEEHAVTTGGKKHYRNIIERYWEPCYSESQKFHLDINEYAPHNAVLMQRYRRQNVDAALNVPCW